jgi:hypothetical protein
MSTQHDPADDRARRTAARDEREDAQQAATADVVAALRRWIAVHRAAATEEDRAKVAALVARSPAIVVVARLATAHAADAGAWPIVLEAGVADPDPDALVPLVKFIETRAA